MAFSVQVQQFNGPLHLLLEIIEREEMEISEVALGAVTESYLQYLDEHTGIPIEELADFLVIAAKLLLLKSRSILPQVQVEEESSEQDLATQLKIYREYLEASQFVQNMFDAHRVIYVHDKLPAVDIGFVPPPMTFTPDVMRGMFEAVVRRLHFVVKIPKAAYEKAVSIHEKIEHIRSFVMKGKTVHFQKVMRMATSRLELVVSFLALLELVKQREVSVSQEGGFGDIILERVT